MPAYQLIAAVGSSFAAGPGIEPVAEADAMRSEKNYAHLLAGRLGARLVDLTVSGATTANLIDTPQQVAGGHTYLPQLDGVPADADIVTMTAGGNDLQFAGSLLYAACMRLEPQSPMATMLKPVFPGGIPLPADHAVEQATEGLIRVAEKARAKAPAARILLVDYLTVLDEGSGPATPFSDEELSQLLLLQGATARVFKDAARQARPELILASSLSANHALGSPEPWVQPFYPFTTQARFIAAGHDAHGRLVPSERGRHGSHRGGIGTGAHLVDQVTRAGRTIPDTAGQAFRMGSQRFRPCFSVSATTSRRSTARRVHY